MRNILYLFFILIFTPAAPAQQDVSIIEYLKQIERGDAQKVKQMLPELKNENPGAPSLIYLEGVLTEDGSSANKLYTLLIEKYPKSTYADAALYRMYSYYSAVNQPELAINCQNRLLKEFPTSPYTKMFPDNVKETTLETVIYKYSIQAGAFSSSVNAENLRRKFVKAGYYTVVKDKNVGGTIFKIVYTGRFKTRTEAENFQVILNKEYGLKGIITQYQE